MSTPDPTPGARTCAPVRTARTARAAWCLIVLLMGLGLALECWGFSRDLPYAEIEIRLDLLSDEAGIEQWDERIERTLLEPASRVLRR